MKDFPFETGDLITPAKVAYSYNFHSYKDKKYVPVTSKDVLLVLSQEKIKDGRIKILFLLGERKIYDYYGFIQWRVRFSLATK